MFQSIDDVQMQTHDPYYDEVDDNEYMIGATPRHLATLDTPGSFRDSQAGVFNSLQAGKNMQG